MDADTNTDIKLRNMTSIYISCGTKILLLYRIGSRVVPPSWCGIGGHFEPDELNDPRTCVLRELEEETGYRVESQGKLEYLMSLNTTVAFCDEAIDIFVAHHLIPSKQHLDEDEVINVEAWELKDLEDLIYSGTITDGKTIAAIMAYARKYRSTDKRDEALS